MELNSKYSINEFVYLMDENKPVHFCITGISAFIGGKQTTPGNFEVSADNGKCTSIVYHFGELSKPIPQHLCFPSIEKLQESLFTLHGENTH